MFSKKKIKYPKQNKIHVFPLQLEINARITVCNQAASPKNVTQSNQKVIYNSKKIPIRTTTNPQKNKPSYSPVEGKIKMLGVFQCGNTIFFFKCFYSISSTA